MKQKLYVQIEYRKTESGIEIVKLHGRCAEVRIPAEIDGVPVVAVAERAFAVKEELPAAEPQDELDAEIIFVTEAPAETTEGQGRVPLRFTITKPVRSSALSPPPPLTRTMCRISRGMIPALTPVCI